MSLFGHLDAYDYGEVHFKLDKATGLRAIVAVHDTRLGPSLGGCRFIHYDTEEDAVIDALRLARGMTYKAALAGLAHGGGKSVLIRPPQHLRPGRPLPRLREVHRRPARPLHHGRGQRDGARGHGGHPLGDQVGHGRGPVARRVGGPVAVHGARRAARHRGVRRSQARQGVARRACTSRCRASVTWATTCARSSTRRARASPSPTWTR